MSLLNKMVRKTIDIKFEEDITKVTLFDKEFNLGNVQKVELQNEYSTKSLKFFYENSENLQKNIKELRKLAKKMGMNSISQIAGEYVKEN